MTTEKILVPDIGEYENVDVIELLVKPGDQIQQEDPLVALETDKATMEIPATVSGIVNKLLIKVGDKVSQGDEILVVETEAAAEPAKAEPAESQAVEPKKAESSTTTVEVTIPDIGDYQGVEVIEVIMTPQASFAEEQALLMLETDKATMEIPAPFDLTIDQVLVKVGDKVSQGDVVAQVISTSAQATPPAKAAEPQVPAQPAAESKPTPAVVDKSDQAIYASPSVRRLARQLAIDLSQIQGSGRKGRITLDDVAQAVQSQPGGGGGAGLDLLADPQVDFSAFGEVETQPLSKIKRLTGANLHRNWVKIPHITLFDQANIQELDTFRKSKKEQAAKAGVKLTPLAFIVKAVAKALQQFPEINASLSGDGQSLIIKKYIHMGIAVDTPKGLVVPVIQNADQKSIYELAQDISHYAKKAQEGKLSPNDMKGGTFTISSLGVLGTTAFTPIINMPEVAILGVSKAAIQPVFDGAQFIPQLMLPLSLSLDHRVIDGVLGAKFLSQVVANLADIREILL